jgi:hypothetical protein
MYERLIETTDWGDHNIPNHTYFRKGTILVGYIKEGTTEFIPVNIRKFSTTRRKFKKSKIKALPL